LLRPRFQSTPLVGAGMGSNPTRSRFLLIYVEADLSLWRSVFCFQLWYGRFNHSKNGLLALDFLIRNRTEVRAMIKGATSRGVKRASAPLFARSKLRKKAF